VAGLRVPPGRAGRLWLRERLRLAEHGLSLLEKKLAILEQERSRLRQLAEQTRHDWEATCLAARTWQVRAELLGGQRSLRLAGPQHATDVTVRWATTAGVRYPHDVDCASPPDDGEAIVGSTTLVAAAAAHRTAITAAARYAVADAAVRAVDREFVATRIRAQGLRRRRVPDLRAALARVELALEEEERSEGIRLRWAMGMPSTRS